MTFHSNKTRNPNSGSNQARRQFSNLGPAKVLRVIAAPNFLLP